MNEAKSLKDNIASELLMIYIFTFHRRKKRNSSYGPDWF